jgi:hypothetical protein
MFPFHDFWTRNEPPQSLLIFFLFFETFEKSLRLLHFESDRPEIWQDDFERYFSSIDGVGFFILRVEMYAQKNDYVRVEK